MLSKISVKHAKIPQNILKYHSPKFQSKFRTGQLALQRPGGPLRSPQCGIMSQHSQSAVLNIVYRGSVSAHFGQAA